ncbi:hypothetical protein [Companilactobacillus nodensis]|nr:hypothetical protein [Companilactobacillus nodensis]
MSNQELTKLIDLAIEFEQKKSWLGYFLPGITFITLLNQLID